jgi:toxin FitB
MSTIILLDTGPLGFVTYPGASKDHTECSEWLESKLLAGVDVRIPEIADYEARRGMLRVKQYDGVRRLDNLKAVIGYVPLTTETMLRAAEFWADMRNWGYNPADDRALDGDMILAAQAAVLASRGDTVVIATTNVKHLDQLVTVKKWREL